MVINFGKDSLFGQGIDDDDRNQLNRLLKDLIGADIGGTLWLALG